MRSAARPSHSSGTVPGGRLPMRRQPATISAGCVPTTWLVPALTVIGRSVVVRSVRQGTCRIVDGLDGLVVLFWYQVHGRVVPTEARTKLLLFGDALRGRGTAGALVRLIAPVDLLRTDSAAAGEREATAFLKAMYPLLRQRLAEQS